MDTKKAAQSDDIKDTIDYAAICDTIHQFAKENSFHLIETFAHRCAELLIQKFQLTQLKLTLKKPAPLPGLEYSGIIIKAQLNLMSAELASKKSSESLSDSTSLLAP